MLQKINRKTGFGISIIAIAVILLPAYKAPGKHASSQHLLHNVKKTNEAPAEDLTTVRTRIVNDLLEPVVDAAKINRLISTIEPDGSWPGINYKDTTKTGFQHSIHLENMLELARAYKKPGSSFYGNAAVKKTVSSALDFWIAHDFICENWWWNEMGTPGLMINTLLLLDPDLTPKEKTEGERIAARASLTGFGARAGGDFVVIAGMVCKQALLKRDDSILQKAIKVMSDQIVITTGRGINPDMGFHHRTDNVTSIHTYGTNYVNAFAYWAVKTAGTRYSLPQKALQLLTDYYVDGISKCMAYSIYPDPGAKNRDLSRKGESSHTAGTEIPENLLMSSDYRRKDLEYLVRVRKGKQKPDLTWDKYFWHSSYFAHQSKNFYTSARMFSSRQNNMEEPYNEEGLKNHHVADGANFVLRTGREYAEVFPVWDWQKIPGTTVVQRPVLPPPNQIAKKGLTDFVGGVSDGQFGAAAFDFKSVHDPLTAHKAWFFFDHEYVCLGTAIRSEADYPVATTINQCLLNGNVLVKTNNKVQTLTNGTHDLQNVSWILHDSIAYLFPQPATLQVSNQKATGSWKDITHQTNASGETVQKDLFTAWFNHGEKPVDATYAYIVVPSITRAAADQYLQKSEVVILSNTADVQAVRNDLLHITEVAFYKPGTITINENLSLTAEDACLVMVQTNGKNISKIVVSDPTEKLRSLQLKVTAPIQGAGNNWKAVWDKESKQSVIKIDLPTEGFAGQSVILQP